MLHHHSVSAPLRAAALCLMIATSALARPSPDGLERLLLPIVAEPLPGQNGSLWETDIWLMLNDSSVFFGPIVNRNCLPPCGPPPPPLPPPGEAVRPFLYRTRPGEPHGVLLFITRGKSEAISLSVRVADTTRRRASAGVSIPVVTERDLRAVVHLLNIDARPEARVRIRVYDAFAEKPVRVRLRVFEINAQDTLVYETEADLVVPSSESLPGWNLPVRPASVEFVLPNNLANANAILRAEVLSPVEERTLWALATITNNLSNEVTIVVP